jgi:hypothetical protein
MKYARVLLLAAFAVCGAVVVANLTRVPARADWNWFGGVRGSGNVVTRTREVEPFTRVSGHGSTDLEIDVGPARQSVVVDAEDNIAPLIETTVRDGTLSISARGAYSSHHGPTVRISVPRLDSVALNGSGDAKIEGARGSDLELSTFGSGDITAAGEVDRLTYSSSGSGDGRFGGLHAREAIVRLRGSGDVHVYATESLDAQTFGSGDVTYGGSPQRVDKKTLGSGEIRGKG